MADGDNDALQGGEQGGFGFGGDDNTPEPPAQPAPQTAPQQDQGSVPPPPDTSNLTSSRTAPSLPSNVIPPPPDMSGVVNGRQGSIPQPPQPVLSGRAKALGFLGNLVNTLLQGAAAGGMASNSPSARALGAGINAGLPQTQQVKAAGLQKSLTENEMAQVQLSNAKLQGLHTEYLIKRLPQQEQIQFAEQAQKYAKFLEDDDADVMSSGDEQSSDAEAQRLNGLFKGPHGEDMKQGAGTYISLPHQTDAKGGLTYSVLWMPTKGVTGSDLQLDNPYWKTGDPDADKYITVPAGTPKGAGYSAVVNGLFKAASQAHKDDVNDFTKVMKMPEGNPDQVSAKIEALQAQKTNDGYKVKDADGNMVPGPTPMYQQNNQHGEADNKLLSLYKTHDDQMANASGKAGQGAEAKKPTEIAVKQAGKMFVGELNGKQVAGPVDELKAAGVKNYTEQGAAEQEKIINARTLENQFDKVLSPGGLLEKNKNNIGAIAGRINTAGLTKGEKEPEYAKLLAQMGLNETALMQVHVGARGSSQLMEHFHQLADAGEMNYDTLKGALEQEQSYVKDKAMRVSNAKPAKTKDETKTINSLKNKY